MILPLPYARLELLIHTMRTRTWPPEAWPLVKARAHSSTQAEARARAGGMVELTAIDDRSHHWSLALRLPTDRP